MTFETDEIATAEECLLSDGWSPLVGTEVDGKTLIFCRQRAFRKVYADIVANDWWDGRAVPVEK